MSLTRPKTGLTKGIRKRRKHFLRKRRYAQAFSDRGESKVAEQLRDCQETEVLACCSSCGKTWWIVNRCRLRVCPLCSFQVAKERGAYLIALSKNMSHPKMLTLTMPLWEDDPQTGIKYLRESFNKLRDKPVFKTVVGGAYQIELKEKPEGWHIHLHALLDCPYIPYQQLFTAWRKILGTSAPQIRIQAAGNAKAIEYVCKYAAKSADFDASSVSIVNWYLATKGQRLFATFGKWYNAKIDDLDSEAKQLDQVAVCPHCQSMKTTFLARDGPWIYGHEDWNEIEQALTHGEDIIRTIQGIEKELTDPERPEEKLEREQKEKTQ